MTITKLKIGTRGSELALIQARWVAERLSNEYPHISVKVVPIKTKGDIVQDVPLNRIGTEGVFVKEIEEALFRDEIDLAVHSMKDVPVKLHDALEIGAIPEREDPRDVFVSNLHQGLHDLPVRARIGTGSLRRRVQLLHHMPQVEIVPIRGNIGTRIRKIEAENLDGIILAAAGIRRMGWTDRISQYVPLDLMIPCGGQGVLGIELKREREELKSLIAFLNHSRTVTEISAERAFLSQLAGGCQVPIGVIACVEENKINLQGMIGSLDAGTVIMDKVEGKREDAEALGSLLAEKILARGGRAVLDSISHCLTGENGW